MLTTDLDLLRLEPRVFLDCADEATVLLSTTDGATTGTALTSTSADFDQHDIDDGSVVIVGSEALEVISRTSTTELEVSRPRSSDEDEQVEPSSGSGLTVEVRTFMRHIARIETQMLRTVGIDPDHPEQPLDEADILNPEALVHAVAVSTIARAYTLAAARNPADDSLEALRAHYARLTEIAFHETRVQIDLDGDGVADATRALDVVTFTPR